MRSFAFRIVTALTLATTPLLTHSIAALEAREVGVVVVYSARIEKLIKPMFDAFTEKTGIEVKYFTAKEVELFERLKAEGSHTPADIASEGQG